jgi:D-xylulose 5-phosphate/D-fructose 6-phosphate phosphoketolase
VSVTSLGRGGRRRPSRAGRKHRAECPRRWPSPWSAGVEAETAPLEGSWRGVAVLDARYDGEGSSSEGAGLIHEVIARRSAVSRILLPPDANCLLAVTDRCLPSRSQLNLVASDEHPQLPWRDLTAALGHCAAGPACGRGRAPTTATTPTSCSRAPATSSPPRPSPPRS